MFKKGARVGLVKREKKTCLNSLIKSDEFDRVFDCHQIVLIFRANPLFLFKQEKSPISHALLTISIRLSNTTCWKCLNGNNGQRVKTPTRLTNKWYLIVSLNGFGYPYLYTTFFKWGVANTSFENTKPTNLLLFVAQCIQSTQLISHK